ncbi:SDR family NAD(P)-dependent oxidoreductase [Bifidobacterium aquikefiricola]|uniref:SDR family NAD(P)-dependent oxidoreductase n=1 Tax=Bifidobacterium aquikefiricola TaxID=3059038 RepID=A0AB39U6H8_9BIFI
MTNVIAIFGAGTGLGLSLAQRYGRAGYHVALVGHNPEHLKDLTEKLEEEGIETFGVTADLREVDSALSAVSAIREHFGRIDVLEYSPLPAQMGFVPALQLDAHTIETMSGIFLLSPVSIIHEVLPEMVERNSGAIFLTHGATVLHPSPNLSGIGTLQASVRHYLMSLKTELADTDIVLGSAVITALIKRSATAETIPESQLAQIPSIDPDDIATTYWNMQHGDGNFEVVLPAMS